MLATCNQTQYTFFVLEVFLPSNRGHATEYNRVIVVCYIITHKQSSSTGQIGHIDCQDEFLYIFVCVYFIFSNVLACKYVVLE